MWGRFFHRVWYGLMLWVLFIIKSFISQSKQVVNFTFYILYINDDVSGHAEIFSKFMHFGDKK